MAEEAQATRALLAVSKKLGIPVDDSQCTERAAANQLNKCYSCAAITDDRTTLKRCGKCQLVWYCSRWACTDFMLLRYRYNPPRSACQRKDWADHKKLCCQQNFDLNNVTPRGERPPGFIGCPGAVPGFVRTPALWRQIWSLSKMDSQDRDYHVS
jgi:hypothetical protein